MSNRLLNAKQVSKQEKQVLDALYDIPITENPLSEISQELGITPDQLLDIVTNLEERRVIRRFAPVFSHRALGYTSNAILLFKTNNGNLETISKVLAKKREISHVFQRNNPYNWNLYAMVHAKSQKELKLIILTIKNEIQVPILIGYTESEIKKTSLRILEVTD